MLKRFFLSFAVTCLLLAAGCRDRSPNAGNSSPGAQSSAQTKKIFHLGNGAEPQFLDPQLATGIVEYALIRALFEGLVNRAADGVGVIPGVAKSWEISEDGLTYTLHLREDARWSDNSPITAQDYTRSYQRMLTPSLAADYAYMMFVVAGAEDYYEGRIKDFSETGFRALDEHTLQLRLVQPTPYLLNALVFYPWCAVPISTVEKWSGFARRDVTWTRPEHFVGNGPFKLSEWRPNQKIVATRSDTYWDRANVKLDEIHYYPVESTDTEERMFRTGQLQATYEMPLSKIPLYQSQQSPALRITPYCGIYFYRFNLARKPLDDVRVRRALTLAIDRESLVRNVTLGGELPAYSLVPPGLSGYVSRHQVQGDLAEAKRLLAEAGFPEGKGFPKVELLYNTMEKHRVVAEALQQMWRQNLGVEIGLYNEEWKVYLVSQKSTNFSMQRAGWIGDYADPHVFFDLWRTAGGNNNTNWGNPEYDRLLAQSASSQTEAERFEVYQKMEKIFLDELPVLPIYFYTKARLISPKVIGFHSTYLDDYPWKFADLSP